MDFQQSVDLQAKLNVKSMRDVHRMEIGSSIEDITDGTLTNSQSGIAHCQHLGLVRPLSWLRCVKHRMSALLSQDCVISNFDLSRSLSN